MPKYSTAFGMDVHLRSTTVCALDADTGEAVTRRFPGNPWGEIAGWMDGFPGPSLAAYESGYLGFAPQRELAGLGVECVVAAVSKIPRSAADSASKNDRNDAARMAKAILAHDISPVWVPSPEIEGIRDLAGAYDGATARLATAKQRLLAFLGKRGYAYGGTTPAGNPRKYWTYDFLRWLDKVRPEDDGGVRALAALRNPSSRWQVSMLAEFGGAAGCSAAGWRRFSNAARRAGAPAAGARRLWEALLASSRSGRRLPAGEDVAVRMLAREIASLDADIEELDSLVADSLAGDEVYECLLTVPGIGPRTAAALVTSIDISAFRGHDELASYCGVAPSDRRSGSSIRSTSAQRGGNRQLKNLLIFSCNSLIGTDNRFGRYYGECRARGMRHGKALKAVARKRLKVIYAIMRDAVPYAA